MKNNRIVIVKTGAVNGYQIEKKGDFEDWIISGMGVSRDQIDIINLLEGNCLPDPTEVAGAVITGSSLMITDDLDWKNHLSQWIKEMVDLDRPLLGICFGHQALAYALGGQVVNNPKGLEVGTVQAEFNHAGKTDLLFQELSDHHFNASHSQTVMKLPAGAVRLATSAQDENFVFRINSHIWGVQFHPEYDREIVRGSIEKKRDTLLLQGRDPEQMKNACLETDGPLVLKRFYQVICTFRDTNAADKERSRL